MTASLVQPLFEGPLDILGDVHGEIDALTTLLRNLGYDSRGAHPKGRRLAFVGDLVDRGPDSPAVVELVRRLVETERAQCVLGNHEFNIFIDKHKADNVWFFQQKLPPEDAAAKRPQSRTAERAEMLRFFAGLPLALERPDLRIVHACWDESMIAVARQATDVVSLHRASQARIEAAIQSRGLHGPEKSWSARTRIRSNDSRRVQRREPKNHSRRWGTYVTNGAWRGGAITTGHCASSAITGGSFWPTRSMATASSRMAPKRDARPRKRDVHRLFGGQTFPRTNGEWFQRYISNSAGGPSVARARTDL